MGKNNNSKNIKKMVTLSMFCAMAYTVMFVIRIPVVPAAPFLRFDPKDVIIIIGGFLYGPVSALIISVIVSLIEMFTATDTGLWGCIANILSSCSLICTASIIYKIRKTLGGAIIGLTAGVILMTIVMAVWNYIAVPLYQANEFVSTQQLREMVKGMLIPVFIPFNLFKGSVNAVFAILLFKPAAIALHKAKLIEPAIIGTRSMKIKWVFAAAAVLIAAALLYWLLNYQPAPPPA